MELSLYDKKMATIKKVLKITYIASLLVTLLALVVLVVFNFAGVFYIETGVGTKYQNGFTYPGWQTIYFGMGDMMIQGYTEATFNIVSCLALYVPFFALIILTAIVIKNHKRKGTNTKRAVLEIITAIIVLVGCILLFNIDQIWIAAAKAYSESGNGSYHDYYNEYLLPALNGEVEFSKTFYPTLVLLVGIFTFLIKGFYGATLIYQKKFAKKNRPVKEENKNE